MPRQGRIQSGTGVYHVMMRGINHQRIFEDSEDHNEDRGQVIVPHEKTAHRMPI